ncbi:MBL fold metallo-hydrolase [Hoeflea olei]|uniref:MBL fold metallo-hydrolase n=1 Tax=Hoeflea olei TaxID=1480615 RepID=A0A1C1YUK0_9HYPH|nr:MBL fold metallo-hydrolase [Hoeflea olei]OCW57076.1 MBL fold metallo-hydrolase [Hoeflea olei]
MHLSRRSIFRLSLAGATSLAAPQILVRAAQAEVPMAATRPAAFKRFTLGDFEITVLSDGHRIVPDPRKIFGTDQSEEDVRALLDSNYLPVDKMQFTFAPTLVNTGEELVLFDTGNGEGGREGGVGRTLANLEASGYNPGQVTVVVLTHLHGDHVGGLMEGDQPAFPNARYVTGQVEYDFWTSGDRIGTGAENGHKTVMTKVAPLAEKMSFVKDGDSVVSGITAMAAFGHTPGHMIYALESGGRKLLLTADTANHFVLSLQRPDWEVVFDTDKAMAAKTRKAVFDMIATDRLPFIGYHMPFPSVGFVEKAAEGYRFIPETYQLDL